MKTRTNTSRRDFFRRGGATLGAGVAAAAAGAGAPAPPAPAATTAADREAIRRLHHAFIAGVEGQSTAAALPTHHAYRANALQEHDALVFGAGGHRATATWHVDVKVGGPVEGDSTVAQMARLQGMLADVHWESGRLHARYARTAGQWQIESMRFERS